MSRYEIEGIDAERYGVVVGWDNPLQTYVASVWDVAVADEVDDERAHDLFIQSS